ncbi:MAG: hypothetical protein KVP17_004221 [Porospora cf. gigantea B]|uniref:uncharacterized protein n=1 Tax=Porospora cf. gigantea B TaxID=2853592 RepID=UPI0035719B1D|nr:MAG: hypothetical protein KVP17_004221 [Porospora cf. gigantea B]
MRHPRSGGKATSDTSRWRCVDCATSNYATRQRCSRCGTLKKAPKTKEDWWCGKCQNLNWGWRERCNECGFVQASAEQTRTGTGGGHFEIQDPKDKITHDSDNEAFDDFGRKKQRKEETLSHIPAWMNESDLSSESEEVVQRPETTTDDTPSIFNMGLRFPPAPADAQYS